MANAVVQARYYESEGTTGASAEGGLKFNREAGLTATAAPIPIPTSTGTNFSWRKPLAIHVTSASSPAQAITNRTIALSGSTLTGLKVWVDPESTFTAGAGGNLPAAGATDDDDPGGAYSEVTTTPTSYHAGSVSSGSTGRNGDFATVVLGVGSNYAGTSGTAVDIGSSARSLVLAYDES